MRPSDPVMSSFQGERSSAILLALSSCADFVDQISPKITTCGRFGLQCVFDYTFVRENKTCLFADNKHIHSFSELLRVC